MDNQYKTFIQKMLNPLSLEELEMLLDELVRSNGINCWHLLHRQALGGRHETYRIWLQQTLEQENSSEFTPFLEHISETSHDRLDEDGAHPMVSYWQFKEKKEKFVQVDRKKATRQGISHATLLLPPVNNNEFLLVFSADELRISDETLEQLVYSYLIAWQSLNISQDNANEKAVKLGKRERQVLSWTSQGKTSYEIAKILNLSEHTINNYVTNAANKLGANNRVHTVCRAMMLGLI